MMFISVYSGGCIISRGVGDFRRSVTPYLANSLNINQNVIYHINTSLYLVEIYIIGHWSTGIYEHIPNEYEIINDKKEFM